jgi:hypothetical protein
MGGGSYHLLLSSAPHDSGTVSSVCLLNVRRARCTGFICADVPLEVSAGIRRIMAMSQR